MKRILVWILVLQFATGHNLLVELMRMPQLLEHYRIHRQETPGLSLGQFLWLHYCNSQHEQADGRHTQLPLHSASGIVAEITVPHPPVFEEFIGPAGRAKNTVTVADEFLHLTAPDSGVFRPPITA